MDTRDAMHEEARVEEEERLLALLLAEQGFDMAQTREITARHLPEPPPLSFAQERLWFLDQLDPGSCTYTMPWALRLHGPLAVWALEQSLQRIVQRHEVLRTTFVVSDGHPQQCIAPSLALPLPVIDLGALPSEARAPLARQLAT